ncbi:hypothetical protein [Silanimonas sp.]|uniref:hypothetical protein n=1 Tax=Silanimonas sp. TaxID=1929290 RepID=UPI0022C2EB17|nr:hypothetical protein [Silanimonas sp.]MCZ8167184.1 hypothetical protein [Silanimonas sp.]
MAQLLQRFPECVLHDVSESGEKTTFRISISRSSGAAIIESLLEIDDWRLSPLTVAEQRSMAGWRESTGVPFKLSVFTQEELKTFGVALVFLLRRDDLLDPEIAEKFLVALSKSLS